MHLGLQSSIYNKSTFQRKILLSSFCSTCYTSVVTLSARVDLSTVSSLPHCSCFDSLQPHGSGAHQFFTMARLISIIGDANVRRNMTGLNVASREVMKSAQIIDFAGTSPFDQALQEVKPEATICIIAAFTDSLVANGFSGTIFASVDPILTSFYTSVSGLCNARPTLQA